jgi:hypothetical protein
VWGSGSFILVVPLPLQILDDVEPSFYFTASAAVVAVFLIP